MNVLCTQIGSRQRYRIPASLHRSGTLAALLTDFWVPLGSTFQRLGGYLGKGVVRRASERFSADIPNYKVRVLFGAAWRAVLATSGKSLGAEDSAKAAAYFGKACVRWCKLLEHDTVFAFAGSSLEVINYEKHIGNAVIVDQVDTGKELEDTIAEEVHRFDHRCDTYYQLPTWYYERLREEWNLADRILVNSAWTKRCLANYGVGADKIDIVPLWVPALTIRPRVKELNRAPLKVLWVGRLCLGKGLVYALEAARLLENAPIEFTFVGRPAIELSQLSWPSNCTVVSHLPASEMHVLYNSHHVLLFPTLSDGFGIVQLEAISHGLILIATERCGQVAEEGRSGFVVPIRDGRAIAERLSCLISQPAMVGEMSCFALDRALQFTEAQVFPHVVECFESARRQLAVS